MNKTNVILIFLSCFLCTITSCGQVKNTAKQTKPGLIDNQLLIGRWYSESDKEYMLVFEKGEYIELYGKDTTDNMYYSLSSSCSLKDTSSKVTMQKAFLLFYSNDNVVQQCIEILNLKDNVLSWMNNTNGKIFVFRKIK